VCGAMGTGDYVYHEKLKQVQLSGGIACSVSDCPGVAPGVTGQQPQPSSCSSCGVRHCGRPVCGVPWSHGHRCWDLLEEDLERRLRHGSNSLHARTRVRLANAPRIRPCPQCGAMVEHVGGCNMVYHDSCRTRWCFVCRRVGTCHDFDCKAPGSGPPTPRGAAQTPQIAPLLQVPSTPRKYSSVISVIWALAALLLLLVTYACLELRLGAPRKGFFLSSSASSWRLGSGTPAPDTCSTPSCASRVMVLGPAEALVEV
ncbi:unnamed protein product, partial [Polarella glacialis]